MLPTITPTQLDVSPGSNVTLTAQTWDDYEALLNNRSERSPLKISFCAATQTIRIMSPLPKHAHGSDLLADLVKALLRFYGLDWQGFDPLTLKKLQQKGLEPDHCFYIQNYRAILGKATIDLTTDPPPDLALEVDLTSFSNVDDYAAIGIPELWIYRDKKLSIYLLETVICDGQTTNSYRLSQTSQLFPDLPIVTLLPTYIERGWSEGSN
ncbi:MAG: Uma2 family endonuclease [Merismopedia sp. SIO2A8]|nr:Uma2 family endonuclease [Merismopedia sp. SIO2A8]